MDNPVMNMKKIFCLVILMVALLLPTSALAVVVTNTANGDVAGDATALTAGTFDIDIISLAVNKVGFLTADGSEILPASNAVARGTLVDFLVYIDNSTDVDISDVSFTDALIAGPPGYDYQPGSMRIGTLPTGGTASALYTEITTAAPTPIITQSDTVVGGEFANADDAANTVWVGNAVNANDQLDVTAGQMWGIVFTVRLQ